MRRKITMTSCGTSAKFGACLGMTLLTLLAAGNAWGAVIDQNTTISGQILGEDVSIIDGLNPPTMVTIVTPALIEQTVHGLGSSNVEMLGGSIGGLITGDNSLVTISGGAVLSEINAQGNSVVNITGGNIASVNPEHHSTMRIFGSGFNFPYGVITGVPSGTLTGVLQSGEPINIPFFLDGESSLVLVPEASTFCLLLLGAAVQLAVAKRRRNGASLL
jgi:hypothetical protein